MTARKRTSKAASLALSEIKFDDLLQQGERMREQRLVNLKVPADVLARVHHLAEQIGVAKTVVIIALLNEGLEEARRRGVGQKG
jgi:type IV secretory pathway component VirB8